MIEAPATPERNKRHPTQKLKGFQWTRLRTRQIQNTIWLKVKYDKYHAVLPYEEIEDLFAAAIVEDKPKGTNPRFNLKPNIYSLVQILGPRRTSAYLIQEEPRMLAFCLPSSSARTTNLRRQS